MARNIKNHLKNKNIFHNIYIDKYNFNFELHKSIFLIDLLKDFYEFTNQDQIIKIFKKKNLKINIQEEVSIDQLIHFLQIDFIKNVKCHKNINIYTRYIDCFGKIEDIKKIVENIKYLNIDNHKINKNKMIKCNSSSSDDY